MRIKLKLWSKYYRLKKFLAPTKIRSEEFTRFLKSKGLEIGDGTHFFDPARTIVDVQRPWMLSIGNYCKITSNCTILAHDYSYSVLRRSHQEVMGGARFTRIGDNVFLGIGTVVCMGANIGNNVIIGAGSVVTGTIPDNSVAAGNPAKVICSLGEFYHKRKEKILEEAKDYVNYFYKKYNKYPTAKQMELFFPLFLPRTENILSKHSIQTHLSGDNETEVINTFYNSIPVFNGLDDLISSAMNK